MTQRDSRLSLEKYAMLKNRIYKIYLSGITDEKIKKIHEGIRPSGILAAEQIADDIIAFPYDKELSDFFVANSSMKLGDAVIAVSEKFDISIELATSKIQEYLGYNYHKLLAEGKINREYVDELSKLYLERNKQKSK